MSFGFANLIMLLGLAGLAIPPLIHLLNRRRYDVVDWGAMQFLQVGETVRRKILLEELLLMLLRMGVIALIVLGLAAPFASHPALADAGQSGRDIVLVFDGSYSMGFNEANQPPLFEQSRTWALDFARDLGPSDRLALLQAAATPVMLTGLDDRSQVEETIAALPVPRGNADWPRAVEEAWRLLRDRKSKNQAEIIVLRDDQLFGWADPASLAQWEYLGKKLAAEERPPAIRVVTLGAKRTGVPGNFALAPLRTTRPLSWPGQRLTFRAALHYDGDTDPIPPQRLRFEVDGQPTDDVSLPPGKLPRGQVPLSFTHRFETAGSHLVSLIVEPELPKDKRSADYGLRDCLPADNRQDLVVEVLRDLPVLLVDGSKTATGSTFFLAKALSQSPDARLKEGIRTQVVRVQDLRPEVLAGNDKPRAVILANVPRLSPEQETALARFLDEGGGVLVVLGPDSDPSYHNERLFRAGQGWLPARLEEIKGDLAKTDQAARPELPRFAHAALEMFRENTSGSLSQTRFPRWWKVKATTDNRTSTWATLTTGDPWLLARDVGDGRVLLCTTPLDRSWDSNFPSIWEYPVLVHEMIYHLAGGRNHDSNLAPGQPLRLQPANVPLPTTLALRGPLGDIRKLRVAAWPFTPDNANEPGPYRVQIAETPPRYFVVGVDRRESDLTPCTAEDLDKVTKRVTMNYHAPQDPLPTTAPTTATAPVDIWWVFLIGVMLLLCGEVWFTRRLALARGVL